MLRSGTGIEILEDRVWERLLRLRPRTAEDVGPVLDLDPASAETLNSYMSAAGRIGPDRVIRYDWPVTVVSGNVQDQLHNAAARMHDAIAEACALLGTLPNLTRAWELGEPVGQQLQLDVVTGPQAPRRAWDAFGSRGSSPRVALCAPPFGAIANLDIEAEARDFISRTGGMLKFLLSSEDLEDAAFRERLVLAADLGIEIRHHPALPSWFWVNDSGEVAIPGTWGDMYPDTVVLLNHQGVADGLHALYERLWAEALPFEPTARDWEPLLRLLYAGGQIEAASRALGLSVRTGRRRIAEAMDHYGVSNLFSLGAAWAKDRRE